MRGEAALHFPVRAYRVNNSMKCTSCGLPLSPSPTYKSCPRCGTPLASGQRAKTRRPFEIVRKPDGNGAGIYTSPAFLQSNPWSQEAGEQMPQAGFVQGMQAAANGRVQDPPLHVKTLTQNNGRVQDPPLHIKTLTQEPLLTPEPSSYTPPELPQQGSWVQDPPLYTRISSPANELTVSSHTSNPGQLSYVEPPQVQPQAKLRSGFLAAGLCVILGGLILLFVYYMALGLSPSTQATSLSTNNGTVTVIKSTANNTSSTPITSDATSTVTLFPGQHYIDNAQMTSSVDPLRAIPLQPTTIFKTRQKAYVTFQLHTGTQAGAVCFIWYLNGNTFFHYPVPVRPNQSASYSYAIYGFAGTGSVELYWASSTRCTDQVLAQRVSFTVTN